MLPELKAPPADAPKEKISTAPVKFEGGVTKVTEEKSAPSSLTEAVKKSVEMPKSEPAPPALATPPAPAPVTPAASPAPAAPAPAKQEVVSEGSVNNNTLITVGGIAAIAVVGVAAGANNGGDLAGATAGATGSGASDVPPNVAEARAWIAKWKARSGKA